MIIDTKYSPQERIFFFDIDRHRVADAVVYAIEIKVYTHVPVILYRLRDSAGPLIPEERCFLTKEQLLKTI